MPYEATARKNLEAAQGEAERLSRLLSKALDRVRDLEAIANVAAERSGEQRRRWRGCPRDSAALPPRQR